MRWNDLLPSSAEHIRLISPLLYGDELTITSVHRAGIRSRQLTIKDRSNERATFTRPSAHVSQNRHILCSRGLQPISTRTPANKHMDAPLNHIPPVPSPAGPARVSLPPLDTPSSPPPASRRTIPPPFHPARVFSFAHALAPRPGLAPLVPVSTLACADA
ncbi:uncharacterized protein LAESUDRAFT_385902 [Laetiporus sulphureus 93-53]|uniref:Uncharacterized protein n=1 Tax=Laetiporus sulphureus 93-53 TaxID=1314785 RepID=A0A165CIR9_9APHY|nr:uncharacterized protein LAESUDRAFT_385902 [Laetiporus sulphureus 93-53]KZT02884.1 hypothetical protein LAESUDRAFT_385902 [Laetiporus sulphureus 93-53]